MSAASVERLSAGYDLPYLEQIKYAIRSMPYGDLIKMAEGIAYTKSHDAERLARTQANKLWDWANANETEKEQTSER